MTTWTDLALDLANHGPAAQATPMTDNHLENLAECALGPTRGDDRVRHLEHIANHDVPLLIREIIRLKNAAAA